MTRALSHEVHATQCQWFRQGSGKSQIPWRAGELEESLTYIDIYGTFQIRTMPSEQLQYVMCTTLSQLLGVFKPSMEYPSEARKSCVIGHEGRPDTVTSQQT